MNTKWEEELIEMCDWEGYLCEKNVVLEEFKAFIKDQITKAQQEIAEQIIEDIPDRFKSTYFPPMEIDDLNQRMENITTDLTNIKQQLRDKWL